MKKLIAILAVMFVIVGAIFAEQNAATSTGNAEVKVVTTVSIVEPTFKLTTASATTNLGNTTNKGQAAGEIGVHTIDVNTLIGQGTTAVEFAVIQIADCKSYKTYTFSATAEELVMTKEYDKDGNLVAYAGEATTANHRAFAVDATTAAFVDGDNAAKALKTNASTAAAYQIKYTGDKVAANTKIAGFTVTWTNDADAVPGQYEAYITLTVASN